MGAYSRYLIKMLAIGMLFVTIALASIIFLTQSLRFLELVMASGASSLSFWLLTLLAMPRFLEIILPIALAASILFTYGRLTGDSELVALRAAGASPMQQARPAFILAALTCCCLWISMFWLGPLSFARMQTIQQVVKAEYSTLLFREGSFNALGDDIMVFIRERKSFGELRGLIIYDSRGDKAPVLIIADRGELVSTDGAQKVVIYDGSRQVYDRTTHSLQRLDFQRYSIDLPQSAPIAKRWAEPDERTIGQLLRPDPANRRDRASADAFRLEIHRRIASPFLTLCFASVALAAMLIGPLDRRGQARRVLLTISAIVLIQSLYLAVFNISRQHPAGIVLMYGLIFLPAAAGLFFLQERSEKWRRRFLYRPGRRGTVMEHLPS